MTTIRPIVTNSPPTPAENFTKGKDQDISKLLEGLVSAWISAASIGVLLILVGFFILIVKTISRRTHNNSVYSAPDIIAKDTSPHYKNTATDPDSNSLVSNAAYGVGGSPDPMSPLYETVTSETSDTVETQNNISYFASCTHQNTTGEQDKGTSVEGTHSCVNINHDCDYEFVESHKYDCVN